jgi:hypothetical protein
MPHAMLITGTPKVNDLSGALKLDIIKLFSSDSQHAIVLNQVMLTAYHVNIALKFIMYLNWLMTSDINKMNPFNRNDKLVVDILLIPSSLRTSFIILLYSTPP